ncbi:hypothetical protein [Mesorhizobium sp. LjNodule214]
MIQRLEVGVIGLGSFGLRHALIYAEHLSDALAGSVEAGLPVDVEC